MSKIGKILPENIYTSLRKTKAALMRSTSLLMNVFPVNDRKIIFSNFNGRGFGDNPKYLAKEFDRRGDFDLFWIAYEDETVPDTITKVKPRSLSCLYHMATSKVWIDNVRKDPYYVKRKNQYYIQTWHGNVALKKIEKDVEDKIGSYYVESAKRDAEMTDLMVSNSAFSDKLYSDSFWYKGDIRRFGSPRLDCLFELENDEEAVKSIKRSLGIPENNYTVLYAPTFRNSLSMDAYDVDLEKVREALKKNTGRDVSVLLRLHPNLIVANLSISSEGAIDATRYPDVYELMAVSDALITDYSSLMFEFPAAKRKPVFCYAKDQDEYDRGFYFELAELPFVFTRTNEELINSITCFDKEKYEADINAFYEKIDLHEDGHASERVVNYLIEEIL